MGHTSETVWPWYSRVSPASWWLKRHVDKGRAEVNFSEWATFPDRRKSRKLQEVCEQVEKGEMPPLSYTLVHPDAKVSDADRRLVCDWANAERAKLPPLPPQPGR